MHYFYYLLCLTFIFSCGRNTIKNKNQAETIVSASPIQKDEVKFVNSIKLLSPTRSKQYDFGEEITIEFENKERFPIDSSKLTINGQEIAKLGKDIKSYTYRLPSHKAGKHTLKVICWHPEHKQGSASIDIYLKPKQMPEQYGYDVINVFPHDTKAYTQGLQYHEGYMYESTGQYGESTLRKTDIKNGNILSVLNLDNQYFGEGITIYKNKIYQITWRSRKGFVYDLKTFTLESSFNYHSEGWGITTAEDHLIMSDGSNKLYVIDPTHFYILKEIEVYDHKGPVNQLNELEYVNGYVWANVWQTDRIVVIDPKTGVVTAELDLSHLLTPAEKNTIDDLDDVLNGIAWNALKNTFYVTGKRWPKMFEIKINSNK